MRRTQAIVLGIFATLALAGLPAISSASVTRGATKPAHALHTTASVITTAHPLHTGVQRHMQPRPHGRHGHSHHAHHGRTELRAAASLRTVAGHPSSAPTSPHRRPAHAHAVLPHANMKLHRSSSRGGAPYALGQASLSLGLWASTDSMPVTRNEMITNPASGILKGRSPPRGIPLNAIHAVCLARQLSPASSPRALADTPRDCRTTPALRSRQTSDPRLVEARPYSGASESGSSRLPNRPDRGIQRAVLGPESRIALGDAGLPGSPVLAVRAFRRGEPVVPIPPDRASEGRAAGSSLPSRRWFK